MYTFQIDDIAKLDLDRIVKENRDAGIQITALPLIRGALLIITKDFLARFCYGDAQIVAGQRLSPTWGQESANVHFELSRPAYSSFHTLDIQGARCLYIKDLSCVADQLRAPCEFQRSIKVTVLQFRPTAKFN